jgi:hypothetical protein
MAAAHQAGSRFRPFLTSKLRYYEQKKLLAPGYREEVWGLVGLHIINFSQNSPWVVWLTFEPTDNILTADGKPGGASDVGPRHRS